MKPEKALARINKSGLIATWNFRQDQWDKMARFYSRHAFEWKKSLVVLLPFVLYTFYLNINRNSSSPNAATPANPLNIYIGTGILIALSVFLVVFYRWFHIRFFPKPKIGERPSVHISADGVMIGDRSFFWEPPALNISEISFKKSDEIHACALFIDVAWGMGLGKVIIPVPTDKAAQAENAIIEILKKRVRTRLSKDAQPLEGLDEQTWFAISSPIADKFINAIIKQDSAGYMSVLNEACKKTTSEKDFIKQRTNMLQQFGAVSKWQPLGVARDKNITAVSYNVDFEKRKSLTLTLLFMTDEIEHKVEAWDLS